MNIRTARRPTGPRAGHVLFVATLLIAAAARAQPPRPAPPSVERIPAPPPPPTGDPDSLARPDFSGVWVLNAKESDDPRPIFETMMPTEKPAGGKSGKSGKPGGRSGIGMRGGSGGGPGMGGGGMGGMDDGSGMGGGTGGSGGMGRGAGRGSDLGSGDDESTGERPLGEARFVGGNDPTVVKARQAFAARLTAGWQRLLIAQAAEEIEIIDGNEQRRIHVLDGQRRDRRGTRVGMLETARWEGDTMVVTLEQEGRPGMTQVYRLVPSEKRLYVTLRLPTRGPGGEKVIRLVYESA